MLYAYFQNEDGEINKAEKNLFFSIQKSYDLYHYLLILIVEIADYASARIEIALQKKIPSFEDLNPNTKFIENKVIGMLRTNSQLTDYLTKTPLTWAQTPDLIKKLHNKIRMAKFFKDYMENPVRSFEEDKKIIIDIYNKELATFEGLYQVLEEQSIFWNDEVEFVISMIIKTIKGFVENENEKNQLLPLFKNKEDQDFVKNLFRKSILYREEYRAIVESFTKNWDIDRIAFMDFLILEMAIAEAVEFPFIPTKVTINEYLEIAKSYSTEKSRIFINGLLDKIFKYLKQTEKIKKTGRGLIGETDSRLDN
ncbi:MAG: transcription antitermination factor NusB [Bacteroidales bacterium]|nr:transcription antitermination factor NusB [Bacteroidales bacterium]